MDSEDFFEVGDPPILTKEEIVKDSHGVPFRKFWVRDEDGEITERYVCIWEKAKEIPGVHNCMGKSYKSMESFWKMYWAKKREQ